MSELSEAEKRRRYENVTAVFGWSGGLGIAIGMILLLFSIKTGGTVFAIGVGLTWVAVKRDFSKLIKRYEEGK
jgi:membrane protein implicated in regulation of membrane protease activity